MKEAEKTAMVAGIRDNSIDQADVVIRKVSYCSAEEPKPIIYVLNRKMM